MTKQTTINATSGTVGLTTFKTMRCLTPLRFVEREGKRILQHPYECLETKEIEWVDVQLVEEV